MHYAGLFSKSHKSAKMNFLKFYVGIIVSILFVLLPNLKCYDFDYVPPDEIKQLLQELHNRCIKRFGLPTDFTKGYDFSNNSPEIMCYMKCLMVEGEWAGEDETVDFDHLIHSAHPEVKPYVEHIVSQCRNLPEVTRECERTYNLFYCAYKADPEHFYLP